ncbi:MAG: RNA methyltransferase [Alicyclobacillus sp.]|nr:RNA methyltransferase [Alicyclobacillus sp.]
MQTICGRPAGSRAQIHCASSTLGPCDIRQSRIPADLSAGIFAEEVTCVLIESPSNARVRAWSQLKTRKGRKQQGQFLVEGVRLVRELLASSLDIVVLLWDVGTDELSEDVAALASARGVPIVELAPSAFAEISDTATPQGVIAVARIPEEHPGFTPANGLVLDGVQDPGNVGTLIRTAEAFGVTAVCCGTGTADPYAPKVVRATMGGLFRTHVVDTDTLSYVARWRNRWPQGRVVVAAASGEVTCEKAELSGPVLLVVGSEAAGVSEVVEAAADVRVRIPMVGLAESLNAAVAGSILLYEVFRQQQG